MKILLVHHLESMWSDGYKKFGTDFYKETAKVATHIRRAKYDKVILIRFEDFKLGDEHFEAGLENLIDEVKTYGYGWERAEMEEQYPGEEGITWAEGCDHSEVVLLEEWMKNLKGNDITVCGAFRNECISTLSAALKACDIKFKLKENLIVG